MEPELDHQCTRICEHAFEGTHAREIDLKLFVAAVAVGVVQDGLRVPRAKKECDAALGRQRLPEAPIRWSRLLLWCWRAKPACVHEARIEPLVEHVDGIALARPIDAVDQDYHWKRCLIHSRVLGGEQVFA